mmetsp:Transcript_101353/g.282102  ORF Transcript_101353/g.282102 Transcript_101353/m.282102 type:complete len:420 (-) Transcript_101353:15-1274(-)
MTTTLSQDNGPSTSPAASLTAGPQRTRSAAPGAAHFLATTMRSKRWGLLTRARCTSLAFSHSASSRCTLLAAEPVGVPFSFLSFLINRRTSSSVINEPPPPPPESCMGKRLSRSASVRFLLAWDTFPLTLSTTIVCLLMPPSRCCCFLCCCSICRTASSGPSSSSQSSSSPCQSSQPSSLPFFFFFFLCPCCFCCCCLCCSSCAALFLSCFAGVETFCPGSWPASSSGPSSSASACAAFARSAVLSLYLRGSGSWAGAGRNCGMSSSLGITGPKLLRPTNLGAFFFRLSSASFSSSSLCFSSCSRILRSLSSRIALRSTGGGPPMLSLIWVRGAGRSTGGATGPTPIFARTASRCFCARVISSRLAICSGMGGESPRRRRRPISIVREVMACERPPWASTRNGLSPPTCKGNVSLINSA